jgi:hypothetical protein
MCDANVKICTGCSDGGWQEVRSAGCGIAMEILRYAQDDGEEGVGFRFRSLERPWQWLFGDKDERLPDV